MTGQGPRGNLDDVRTIEVSLPRLNPDSAATCPIPFADVIEHVQTEYDDGSGTRLQLIFVRTAKIGSTSYWIWRFTDPSHGDWYALVSFWPPKLAVTECDDAFDMTPEQFIVASHRKIEP
jgi:hypothetical protein